MTGRLGTCLFIGAWIAFGCDNPSLSLTRADSQAPRRTLGIGGDRGFDGPAASGGAPSAGGAASVLHGLRGPAANGVFSVSSGAGSGVLLESRVCGDGIRDSNLEECDDGEGAEADLCNERCQVSDALVARGADPAQARRLGEGRHPVAAGPHGFGVTLVEPSATPPLVAIGVFDAAGDPRSHIPVSTDTTPASFASPVAAALADGSYAVAWTDFGGDGDELGVALRRVVPGASTGTQAPLVGADLGAQLSDVQHANAMRAFSQYDADLLLVGDTLVVAWTDVADPETAPDIRFRTFDVDVAGAHRPFTAASEGDETLAESFGFEGNVALAPFGSSWAAAWRSAGFDGLESVEVTDADSGTRWTVGPHLGGAPEDRPALVELDPGNLLLLYTVGTDPENTGVANVGRLRAALLRLSEPTNVQQLDVPPSHPDYADPAIAQSHPSMMRAGERLFYAYRSASRPGDSEAENIWLGSIVSDFSGPELRVLFAAEHLIPRWPLASFGDQRFPALASAPPFVGTPGLPDPAPEGALVVAWEDFGQTFGAGEGQPDVLVQHWPLEVRRSETQVPTDCTVADPCGPGDGDCDSDAECRPGLICAEGAGPKYRWLPTVDVCVPPHCADAVRNGDETGVDCGGLDCGVCHCGDGFVLTLIGEQCDDANADNTDACPTTCKHAFCGDGFARAGVETCDTAGDSATCDADCTARVCGDGHLNTAAGEQCDDGNMDNTDQCPGSCAPPVCGDGYVLAGVEQCDLGGEGATCDADCTPPQCGDGVVNEAAGEVCEPSLNGRCLADCSGLGSCTNGAICLTVQHKVGGGSTNDNTINPQLRIINNSTETVPLNQLRVRYWFTRHDNLDPESATCEQASAALNTFCDFATVGCSNVVRSEGVVSPWLHHVDSFLDLTWNTSVQLAPGQNTQVDVRMLRADTQNFNESNDYSWRTVPPEFAFNPRVALYRSGQLYWGIEPMTPIVCGDGVTDSCETCDMVNQTASCDSDCSEARCGDGHLNPLRGEQCEPNPAPESANCDNDCTFRTCGDGHVNPVGGEVCEPSIVPPCRSDCTGFTGTTGCVNGAVCLKVQHRANDSASDDRIRPTLRIVNNGFVSLPLSELRVRYWFTNDGSQSLQSTCDSASFPSDGSGNNCSQVTRTFTTVSPAKPGADRYLEVRFTGSHTLAAGASTGEISLSVNKAGTPPPAFNENNDYSRRVSATLQDHTKITVYRNTTLIWGTPP